MTTGDALRALGLPSRVHWEEVRLTYLDLVRVWHPDRFQSDPALQARAAKRLAEINEAYRFLQDVRNLRRERNNRPKSTPASPSPLAPPPQASSSAPPDQSSRRAEAKPTATEQRRPDPERHARRVAYGVIAAVALLVVYGLLLGPQDGAGRLYETPASFSDDLAAVRTKTPNGNMPGTAAAPRVQFTLSDIQSASTPTPTTATVAPAPESPPLTIEYSQTVPGVERPESGVALMRGSDTGLGTLNVRNGTGRDAVVVMFEMDLQRRAVYIRTGTTAAIPRVAPGSYTVRFTSGAWWNGEEFLKETTFLEFDRPVVFEETSKADGIQYSDFDLTLQAVIGGNVRTSSTPPFRLLKDVFLQGR
jgi:hypothetical protein